MNFFNSLNAEGRRTMKKLDGYTRFDIVRLLGEGEHFVGIELGVAAGDFSQAMVKSGLFKEFWGVDMYADTHDTAQYKEAITKVGIGENYKLLRMTFDDAIDLFPENYFDFIYLDGYAGNGFEGGKTLRTWASKVKVGGIIAGDDYHEECPLLKRIVDEFVNQNDFEFYVTEGAFDFSAYGHYPSWAVRKTHEVLGETSLDLMNEGLEIARRSKAKKKRAKKIDDFIKRVLPIETHAKLRNWNRDRKQARRRRKAGK